jgi:hypothetical protein
MRNWDLRELCVQVNLPSAIWLVRLLIRRVITPIQGLPNAIRQVRPQISHIFLYPPHRSHIHRPSHSFSSTTLPSAQNPKLSYPSHSLYVTKMNWQWVQHTPSTAYTEYSIHRTQAYTEYSIHRVQNSPSTAFSVYRIHRVQHRQSTACTQDYLVFFQSHDYELTPECSFSSRRSSLHNRPPSARTALMLSHIFTFPWLWVY